MVCEDTNYGIGKIGVMLGAIAGDIIGSRFEAFGTKSKDFEDAIRTAISLGGDSDTIACMTGGISQAFYRAIPEYISKEVKARLPEEFLNIIHKFEELYI